MFDDPRVLDALEKLWACANANGDEAFDKPEYVTMHRKMILWLQPLSGPAEARRSADADWLDDTQGHDSLDYERFCWSWFELADMWTETISPKEFLAFLDAAVEDLAVRLADGSRVWQSDSEVPRVVLHAVARCVACCAACCVVSCCYLLSHASVCRDVLLHTVAHFYMLLCTTTHSKVLRSHYRRARRERRRVKVDEGEGVAMLTWHHMIKEDDMRLAELRRQAKQDLCCVLCTYCYISHARIVTHRHVLFRTAMVGGAEGQEPAARVG